MKRVTYLVPVLCLVAAPALAMKVAPNRPVACPMIAKMCPDGSSVSPTGPNCEIPACPGGDKPAPAPMPVPPISGSGTAEPGSTGPGTVVGSPPAEGSEEGEGEAPTIPGSTGQVRLETLPDMPLDAPKEPQSVKFIVEHRSALNGQHLTVHGVVVMTNLADKACVPGNGNCQEISVSIADTAEEGRNKTYDLNIMLPRNDKTGYAQGQIVDISGTVNGAEDSVSMQKE